MIDNELEPQKAAGDSDPVPVAQGGIRPCLARASAASATGASAALHSAERDVADAEPCTPGSRLVRLVPHAEAMVMPCLLGCVHGPPEPRDG